MYGALARFVAIALAWLLLAGVVAAQAQTKSETKTETKAETKSESRSNHLRGGWYPWDPYQYRDWRGRPISPPERPRVRHAVYTRISHNHIEPRPTS